MRNQRHLRFLPLLGLLASIGLVVSGIGVRNAVMAVRVLRTEVVLASAAHDDVQFYMQESRQRFLYAMTTEVEGQRASLIEQARKADGEVEKRFAALGALGLPAEALQGTGQFRSQWFSYLQARDQAVALLGEGQPSQAVRFDAEYGADRFQGASEALQQIRRHVSSHAESQSGMVESTLFRLIFELILLVVTLGSFAWALVGSRTERNQEREKNDELARNARLDAQRSRVLEMTGKNEPLPEILSTLCSLMQQQLPGAVGAISLFQDGQLREIVGLGLPGSFIDRHLAQQGEASRGANWTAFRGGEPVYSEIASDELWGSCGSRHWRMGFSTAGRTRCNRVRGRRWRQWTPTSVRGGGWKAMSRESCAVRRN